MDPAGHFVSSRATPALARLVDAFWAYESAGGAQRILPDGCIDFIFDLATGDAHVQGPMTSAEVIALPAGARVFGVRFLPGAASAFLEMDAEAIEDRAIDLDEVSAARKWSLGERVAEARDHTARRRTIADFLFEPRSRQKAADARLAQAIRAIRHSRGALPVAAVARDLAMSERTLERLFRAHVGVRPKLYARIARLEWTREISTEHGASQAALAAMGGYADEPHLVREFRALTGLTPSALAAEERVGFVQVGDAVSR
ncbi:MAG: AraC family transcriptional regulator [Polyangiaceae bacterium]